MAFSQKLFRKLSQHSSPTFGTRIDAIAVVSHTYILMESQAAVYSSVTDLVKKEWPEAKLPPKKQIQTQFGLSTEDDPKDILLPMLHKIIKGARLNPEIYEYKVITFGSDSAFKLWLGVAIFSPAPAPPKESADFIRLFKDQIKHISRDSPELKQLVDDYFDDGSILAIASTATGKMKLTKSDNEHHSIVIGSDQVLCHISTIVSDLENASNWFVYTYGGYTQFLEKIQNAHIARVPDGSVSVWCHIIYGYYPHHQDWVRISICPVSPSTLIDRSVMPVELLTMDERHKLDL